MLSCHLQRIFLGSDQVSRRWWIVNGFCQYCSDKCILRGHIRLFVLSTRENFHRMVRSLIWFSCPSEHKGISEVWRIAGLWKMLFSQLYGGVVVLNAEHYQLWNMVLMKSDCSMISIIKQLVWLELIMISSIDLCGDTKLSKVFNKEAE